jgi:hypothetical protein
MIRPTTLQPKPSFLLALQGGLVASILLSALIFLGPAFGLRFVDIPGLLGGLFTANAAIAFGVGFLLFFIPGVIVFPSLLAVYWYQLPGPNIGFIGGALKGLLLGIGLWLLTGLLLPLLGAINQLAIAGPGFFALDYGLPTALGFLAAYLIYGLALGLLTAVGQGIEPLEAVGWPGYKKAYTPEISTHFEGKREMRPN